MRHFIRCVLDAARHPRVAALGAREFRCSFTTHFEDDLLYAYDSGRELAHMFTLRHYED